MVKPWFVYIVTNYRNSVLYVGITNNLKRRIWEHKKGLNIGFFSKKHRLYKLIWFEEFNSPETAILMEKKIKGWRRSKKLELVRSLSSNFNDLLTLRPVPSGTGLR